MRKLIIADDEITIREGLRDFIDWISLGIEIVGIYADGREVIEHLNNREEGVDIVISDIKMTFNSGIDVARYVFEHHLSTSVILISGYKEFEFAKDAVKYGVKEYILKPIDTDEVIKVINKIIFSLDEEDYYMNNNRTREYIEQINNVKENFFNEVISGAIKNEHSINNMFKAIYPKIDVSTCKCFFVQLCIKNYNDFMENTWKRTNNESYFLFKNFFDIYNEKIEYRLVYKKGQNLSVLGIATQELSADEIKQELEKMLESLKHVLNIECTVTEYSIFEGIIPLIWFFSSYTYADYKGNIENIVTQAKAYIEENILKDISLEDISDQFNISQYHFSRTFKTQTGENLIDYIIRLKIKRSMELLEEANYKVYEVSEMVGYKSTQYFYKVFKSLVGVTPTEYRKKLLIKQKEGEGTE